MKIIEEGSAYAEYDQSARLESESGAVTTFYQIMTKKKGGGDVEKAEVVLEDDGEAVHAYRVEGELFTPRHPEWIIEARTTDASIGEVRAARSS